EIEKLKPWIRLRLQWLDASLPGQWGPAPPPDPAAPPLRVVPNPAVSGEIYVQGRNTAQTHYTLYDAAGRKIRPLTAFQDAFGRIDVSGLPAGVYLVRVSWPDGSHGADTVRFLVF
ncbi:MAG TPA: T9SS type A sorting domain-containing protein, partial [Flavilitoribacter sp.]|nr:T9SS type A sorting domain-containing protein [Flavilitoribacter sp.]